MVSQCLPILVGGRKPLLEVYPGATDGAFVSAKLGKNVIEGTHVQRDVRRCG